MLNRGENNNNNNNNNQQQPPEEPPAPPIEEEEQADDENEEELPPEVPPAPPIEQEDIIDLAADDENEERQIEEEEELPPEVPPGEPPAPPIEQEDIIDLAADDNNEEQPMEQNDDNNQQDTSSTDSDSDGPLEQVMREHIAQEDPIEQEAQELPPLEQRVREIIGQQDPIEQEAQEQPHLEQQREIYVPQEDLNQIPQNIQQEIPPIDEIDVAIEDLDADQLMEEEEQADDENEEQPIEEEAQELPPIQNPKRKETLNSGNTKRHARGWPGQKLKIDELDEDMFYELRLIDMGIDRDEEQYRNKEAKDIIFENLFGNTEYNNKDVEELPEDFRDEEIDEFIREVENEIRENERDMEEQQQYQNDIENLWGQRRDNYKRTPDEKNASKRVEVTPIPYATLQENRQQIEELMQIPDEEFTTSTNEPASLTEGGKHFNSRTAEKTKGRVKWYKVKPSDRLLQPLMRREWKYSDDEKHVTEKTKYNIKSKFRVLYKKVEDLVIKMKEDRTLNKKEKKLLEELKMLKGKVEKLPDNSKSRRMKKLEEKLKKLYKYNVC